MKKRIIAIMVALACGVGSLCAQTVIKSETFVPINGVKMYIHKMRPGETIEAIAKAYNTTEDMQSLLAVNIYNNLYGKFVNDRMDYYNQ